MWPEGTYVMKAQLGPAALAAVPAVVLGFGALSSIEGAGSIAAFTLATVLVVVCGVVRGFGRRLEPALWESWGGPPTTRLLRWSDASSPVAMERRHVLLSGVLGESLPSSDEERLDPAGADARYAVAVSALRQRTRSGPAFKLVAQQNAEYGLRRNCLGLRPVALVVATVVLAASAVLLAVLGAGWNFVLAAGVSGLALLAWDFLVTPDWVRAAADLYAQRLMEAIESLAAAAQTENQGAVGRRNIRPSEVSDG
jgi:hypothetical protein